MTEENSNSNNVSNNKKPEYRMYTLMLEHAEDDAQDDDCDQQARRAWRAWVAPRAAAAVVLVFVVTVAINVSTPPPNRHQLQHDYSLMMGNNADITTNAMEIEDWCLFGGNDACQCQESWMPSARENTVNGWRDTHEAYKARIVHDTDDFGIAHYDIVFYGDDLVENLYGFANNQPIPGGIEIANYFKQHFTYEYETSLVNSIAMGITGDSTGNLLWRLQNGEMPDRLDANVLWLMVGTSDLARLGCSEDAVVLGILRVLDTIHQAYPHSVIVLQGILPRTNRADGLLEPQKYGLWPSIQHINWQLELFCEYHEYFVYFDVTSLFLQDVQDETMGKTKQIIKEYMPDFLRLSPAGWKMLGSAILEEYNRIVWNDNDAKVSIEEADDEIETDDLGVF